MQATGNRKRAQKAIKNHRRDLQKRRSRFFVVGPSCAFCRLYGPIPFVSVPFLAMIGNMSGTAENQICGYSQNPRPTTSKICSCQQSLYFLLINSAPALSDVSPSDGYIGREGLTLLVPDAEIYEVKDQLLHSYRFVTCLAARVGAGFSIQGAG